MRGARGFVVVREDVRFCMALDVGFRDDLADIVGGGITLSRGAKFDGATQGDSSLGVFESGFGGVRGDGQGCHGLMGGWCLAIGGDEGPLWVERPPLGGNWGDPWCVSIGVELALGDFSESLHPIFAGGMLQRFCVSDGSATNPDDAYGADDLVVFVAFGDGLVGRCRVEGAAVLEVV